MPDRITDPPPADVADQLAVLSGALDRVIPAKQPGGNLLIGTWNVRGFDRLTPKWRSVTGDSPIRDLSNLLCIAEVVRRFDVIAVQEVRRSAQAFLAMLQVLGGGVPGHRRHPRPPRQQRAAGVRVRPRARASLRAGL
jgi:endonuclease/exonuclease/phosphatase family protein